MMTLFLKRTIREYLLGWTQYHHLPKTSYTLVEPLLHVHFEQPLKGTTQDFFFVEERSPAQIIQTIDRTQPNRSHWLTVFSQEEPSQEMMSIYERLGYQCKSQEGVMTKRLVPEKEVPPP